MPAPLIPKALKPGGTIAFVSPSARLNHKFPEVMARATALLTDRGYKVREFYNRDAGIQDGIANRLSELRAAFMDPEVDAIICTVGGPSFNELIPALVADTELHETIRADPKIVIGYSDITGLHWVLHATTGLRTFYGPGAIPELGEPVTEKGEEGKDDHVKFMARNLFRTIDSSDTALGNIERSQIYVPGPPLYFYAPEAVPKRLKAFPERAPTPPWTWIRPGRGKGRLFGGCLTVMARLGGVKAIAPDWRGRIVFLETAAADDVMGGNPIERVRAGVADLIAQGVFDDAAGLVVGRPLGYDSLAMREEYMGVIRGLLCDERPGEKSNGSRKKEFPILFGVDFGHTMPLVTLPYDTMAELDSEADRFAVLEAAVV